MLLADRVLGSTGWGGFAELAARTGRSAEEVAEGFIGIAVQQMANAIKKISVARGYDVTRYTLQCFGGAGGQHACMVADALGMKQVYVHPLAGVLSAYGMGLADQSLIREQAVELRLTPEAMPALLAPLQSLGDAARAALSQQALGDAIELHQRVHVRYEGSDSALVVSMGSLAEITARFEQAYRQRFAFLMTGKSLMVEAVSVEALIKAGAFDNLHLNRAELLASVERAFDFASASEANANQSGLFDMMGEDAHGSSTQEPEYVEMLPWGVKERLTHEKVALGFYLSGHLFDEVEREVRRFARTRIEDLMDSREPQLLAGIVSDMRVINGQRGKLAIFKLDDKSTVIEATADEATINTYRNTLKDDELVIIMGKAQPDRFSGGLRLSIQQVWSLEQARCRFGKYLSVTVNGTSPDIARLLREHPAKVEQSEQGELVRGMGVRLKLLRDGATADVQLGDSAKFFPSDAALASWMAQAHEGQSQIIYE